MTEYEKVDDIFRELWDNCICKLSYNMDDKEHNAVLFDSIHSKIEDILDIVNELMAERDDLLDKIMRAKNDLER